MIDYDEQEACLRWVEKNRDRGEDPLPASEVFGPTLQGEGPHAGRPCHFIRLGGCNLSCSWCDTPYSTGQHGIPLATVPRRPVVALVEQIPPRSLVIITGGEPLMHAARPAFEALLLHLRAKGCEIHVETNGTIVPPASVVHLIDHYSISPKIGVEMVKRAHRPTLANWAPLADRVCFKFVVEGDGDPTGFLTRARDMAVSHGCDRRRVWAMPEGATAEELAPRWRPLADACAKLNINASHRLHALAWGDAKGH